MNVLPSHKLQFRKHFIFASLTLSELNLVDSNAIFAPLVTNLHRQNRTLNSASSPSQFIFPGILFEMTCLSTLYHFYKTYFKKYLVEYSQCVLSLK